MLRDLGLDGAEINSGGFLPAPHRPTADIRAGGAADHLGVFAGAGMALQALNCNGNPLHPDMNVAIEREDQELGQLEGLASAAATLLEAAGR